MSHRICSVPECGRPLIARELCSMHYQRMKHRGTTDARPAAPNPPCSIDGCDKISSSRGWCEMHYGRWRRTGTTDDPTPRARRECAVHGCDAPKAKKTQRGLCDRHAWRMKHHGDPGPATVLVNLGATVCSIDGCDRTGPFRRGWCSMHYQRWQNHGDPTRERNRPAPTCTIDGCSGPHASRGLCGTHYMRLLRTGTTDLHVPRPPQGCSVDGCETETAARGLCSKHYGRLRRNGSATAPVRERGAPHRGRPCAEHGCSAPAYNFGLCKPHYQADYHEAHRDEDNDRMRAHYAANRHYYVSKTTVRRRVLAATSPEERAIAASYRKAIAGDPCFYCGGASDSVDHFYPVSKGGGEVWVNLVRACEQCNKRKAARCGTWFMLRGDCGSTRPVPALPEAGSEYRRIV